MIFDFKRKTLAVLFLTVSAVSAAPRLGVSTTTVSTVNVTPGSNGTTQTIEAFNLGDGSLNLSATASAPWLAATVGAQKACTTRSGNCLPVSVALNTSGLTPGIYTEFVTLTDPNAIDSPQDVAVTINVAGVPSTLTAYVTPSGGPTSSMIFPIFTSGTGVKSVVTTQSGGNWLQFLSGSSGLINYGSPFLIQVAAQVGMAPGTYNGTIVVSGSSVASDNKTINVTLNVTASPIIQLNNTSTIRLTGSNGGAIQYSVVTLNNQGQGSLNVTGVTSSNKFLTATVSGTNGILLAADPTGLTPGVYNASVTVQSNAANSSAVSIPVELLVSPAGQPLILSGGIVNIANGAQEAVAQGDIVAIYGTQLAPAGTSATNQGNPPLATTLGTVQVLVNNVPAPLYFVSPGQINFQIPYSLAVGSTATVQVVSNGVAGNTRPIVISASAPRLLFFVTFIQGSYGIIVNNTDGSLTLPTGTVVGSFKTHPAKPGDTIIIYGIGFGQTSPAATAGVAAVGLQSVGTVNATFGGGFAGRPTTVAAGYAGLTPTAVGLYQLNVTIPADAPLGNSVPVSVVGNGVQSNVVYLAITASGK